MLPAQDSIPAGHRPKLGLVLSGGGAKGLTHVGVLKVLETAGIRPDFITGTRMGSIVGGLYAMGYPADTLERIVRSLDWDRVLSDNLPLQEVVLEEKAFFQNQLLELPWREGGFQAPTGLIHGQQIDRLLNRLTLPAYGINDFDRLPIPFRCVASDIVTGEAVLLKEGILAQALRASMAIPTVFTPVETDSFILVDGGLVRNFPVGEVFDMGAELAIGVYAGARNRKKEEIASLVDIMGQAGFLMSIKDAEMQIPRLHTYLEPRLKPFGAEDFNQADSIMLLGERAARRQLPQLRMLADSLDQIGPPPPRPRLPVLTDIFIDTISVEGNQLFDAREIIGKSGLRPEMIVSVDDLEAAVDAIYGTNLFHKVSYSMRRIGAKNLLTLYCEERPPAVLRTSLFYDSYREAGFAFNLAVRNFLLPASRLMLIGKIAGNYMGRLEYLKYLDEEQHYFVQLRLDIARNRIPIFQEGLLSNVYRTTEVPVGVRVRKRMGNNVSLGAGLEHSTLFFHPEAGSDPLFDRLRLSNINTFVFLEVNTLDRNVFPRRGTRLQLEVRNIDNTSFRVKDLDMEQVPSGEALLDFEAYHKITFDALSFVPLGADQSLLLRPFASVIWNLNSAFGDYSLVGGPEMLHSRSIPFAGLDPNELIAQVIFGGQVGYQHFLNKRLLARCDFSGAFIAQPSIIDGGLPDPDTFLSGLNLTLGYNSLLGPLEFSLMLPFSRPRDISGRLRSYLSFGYRF